ncbi:diacylglycerol kinase family protein [Streptomyces sp. R21]|uniref:Diacylglycerol kinase family protein n=1 Tax=Streptomyces sp. R21 TaxID=3238627 RepID=A0AB39P210_9ACTN
MSDVLKSGPDVLKSVLVVANPAAGSCTPDAVEKTVGLLSKAAATVELRLTAGPDHARTLAREAVSAGAADTVVAIGGDGTAHEVMTGLMDAGGDAALLALPFGTGNSFYRAIWSDRPWRAALDAVLATPYVRRIDLAAVAETGGLALLGASSGLAAQTLVTAREVAGTGRDRYQEAVTRAVADGFRPYPGRVTVDGVEVHRGPTVCANVGGGRHRAGRFLLLPHSALDDGLLDVCVAGPGLPLPELLQLARDGAHVGRKGVVYARGRRIVVERTDGRPVLFEYDGDLAPKAASRYTLDVVPRALTVLAPPRS